jgi:hypothetical protein
MPLVFESPTNRRLGNVRLAGQFIAAHENEIHADTRFRNVHFGLHDIDRDRRWSPQLCILVIGSIESETDAQNLKRLLMAMRPPVELCYQLDVTASHHTDPTKR